jgi:hypothetical protein
MSRVRLQPSRRTKKSLSKTIKNPFQECLSFLPPSLSRKFERVDRIVYFELENMLFDASASPADSLALIK